MKQAVIVTLCIMSLLGALFCSYYYSAPEANAVCFYYHVPAQLEKTITLDELKEHEATCFDDKESLQAFNNATGTLGGMWKGGFYGHYIDDKGRKHIIKISTVGAYFLDAERNRAYSIKNKNMLKIWKKIAYPPSLI